MRSRIIILAFILLTLPMPASAFLKDIPPGHWSSMAIYDLVQLGVTQGYPDGTFGGDKLMSRYETAVFMYKLQKIVSYNAAVSEKLVEELKTELEPIKQELADIEKPSEDVSKFSGTAFMGMRFGKSSNEDKYGSKADYRITTSYSKSFNRDFSARLNFDTLDSGMGDGERPLNEMLNLEGKATIDIFGILGDLKATFGPGQVIHREPSSFQADDYTVMLMPYNILSFATVLKGYEITADYTARSPSDIGYPFSNELGLTVGFPKFSVPVLNDVTLTLRTSYVSSIPALSTQESEDERAMLRIMASPSPKMEIGMELGMRESGTKSPYSDDRYLLSLGFSMNDYFNTGTYLSMEFNKAGAHYRVAGLDKYEFGMIDQFDRLILDGTTDLGIYLSQDISNASKLYLKGSMVMTSDMNYGPTYPGTSTTLQEGFQLYIPSGMILDINHKTYEIPSAIADAADPGGLMRALGPTSDVFEMSMNFSF